MRSAPTAACEIHANIEPLGKRREKAALELYEKTMRTSCDNPNRILVENWQPTNRLQQKSVLHKVWELKEKHHLPDQRKVTSAVLEDMPPNINLNPPEIRLTIK